MIEGEHIRLVHHPQGEGRDDAILAVMKGGTDDKENIFERIVELEETSEIGYTPTTAAFNSSSAAPAMWDEWDM
jgi:hypothetical protein